MTARPPHLGVRAGPRPRTTPTNPHKQLDLQTRDTIKRALLTAEVIALPGVVERERAISVPGARALWLEQVRDDAPHDAFIIGAELAHLHPGADQSLHVMLPLSS